MNFELKIPPLLLAIIFGTVMWAMDQWLPSFLIPRVVLVSVVSITFLAGATFCILGVVSFKRANTTVNPMTPEATSALVTTGIYKITRNPMYVGFLLFLVAWGVCLSNGYSLFLITLFVIYMNRFQILPEERVLMATFKEDFSEYAKHVRRWL